MSKRGSGFNINASSISVGNTLNVLPTKKFSMMSMGEKDIPDTGSMQSSSSSEKMDGEGRLAVKDIVKLTESHLDVKPLELNLSTMRKFVPTPKNGVKVPRELNAMIGSL